MNSLKSLASINRIAEISSTWRTQNLISPPYQTSPDKISLLKLGNCITSLNSDLEETPQLSGISSTRQRPSKYCQKGTDVFFEGNLCQLKDVHNSEYDTARACLFSREHESQKKSCQRAIAGSLFPLRSPQGLTSRKCPRCCGIVTYGGLQILVPSRELEEEQPSQETMDCWRRKASKGRERYRFFLRTNTDCELEDVPNDQRYRRRTFSKGSNRARGYYSLRMRTMLRIAQRVPLQKRKMLVLSVAKRFELLHMY